MALPGFCPLTGKLKGLVSVGNGAHFLKVLIFQEALECPGMMRTESIT